MSSRNHLILSGRHSTGLKINGSKLRKPHLVKPFSSTFRLLEEKINLLDIFFLSKLRRLINVKTMPLTIFTVIFFDRLSDAGSIAFSNLFLIPYWLKKMILASDFVSLFLSRCANSCVKTEETNP